MSYTDENHRYRPYYRQNRRYDDEQRHQYKKPTKHHYQYPSTSRREQRNYHDSSYRRSHKNDYHYSSTKSKSYSYFSSPPPPLMAIPIAPPLLPLPPPPPPPPPPPSSVTIVPHERESWVRSVKRTKMNESTEQKTQYLETMLRMPQQKSSLNASKFDRMRFSDHRLPIASTITNADENLDNSSFHLIDDIHTNDEIRAFEQILFENEIAQRKSPQQALPTPPQSVNESEPVLSQICSGFLIDNCDDEEELPTGSPPPQTSFPPSGEEFVETQDENLHEERAMLVSELDAADAERRQELKRQKHLHRKLQKKKKEQPTEAIQQPQEQQEEEEEPSSDWVVEYDRDQVSNLRDEIRRTSITMSNEDKTEKVNLILLKIKKQQEELKKLKQYVMSMLNEEDRPRSTKGKRASSSLTQDLLLNLFNPPATSGCWLCSGKMYSEVATQCQRDDQSDQQ